MKALLTAGGRATRLRPITWTLNKHLIPLANKPMLGYAIEKLVDAGITEIGINVNAGDTEIAQAFGDGSKFGAKLSYLEQPGGPLGIAHAVNAQQAFLGDEPFIFFLGDNIVLGSLKRFVDKFESEKLNCLLALSRVKNPNRFGVPVFDEAGKITSVEEKPENPKSQFAVTGIYVYDKSFFEAFKHIQPSARGEYEISDIHTWLLQNNYNVGHEEITGWWKDTGNPEDLLEGNALFLNELPIEKTVMQGEVMDGAVIQGKVSIGAGTKIGPRVLIRGPVVIGEGCIINDAYIGPYTAIGNSVTVDGTEIEHSIVFDGAAIRANKRIVDSLIGKNAVVTRVESSLPHGHKLVVGDHARVEL